MMGTIYILIYLLPLLQSATGLHFHQYTIIYPKTIVGTPLAPQKDGNGSLSEDMSLSNLLEDDMYLKIRINRRKLDISHCIQSLILKTM